ncbi:hypothetical protein DPX39_020032100 [Trypanosoma brucei equiperdum]|uniref:Uncharacterized protein n=1 Tax=Trypanosoma brucei equiperdum TaxID=630700 RepID=A0A3L6LBM5_9TRYP|nr:hypothetical protein DPX39_020032100 [Trypanosoma brucei equiperdum]
MSTTAVLFTFAEFARSQEFPDILHLFPVPSPESWSFLCLRHGSVTVFTIGLVTESSAGVSRACELSPMVSTASRFATILIPLRLQVAVGSLSHLMSLQQWLLSALAYGLCTSPLVSLISSVCRVNAAVGIDVPELSKVLRSLTFVSSISRHSCALELGVVLSVA